MPFILDPAGWSEAQLREQATGLRDGLAELAGALSRLPTPMANPWAIEAGVALLQRSVDLANEVLGRERVDSALLAGLTNQLYEVGASFGFLMLAAQSPPPALPARKTRAPPPTAPP